MDVKEPRKGKTYLKSNKVVGHIFFYFNCYCKAIVIKTVQS